MPWRPNGHNADSVIARRRRRDTGSEVSSLANTGEGVHKGDGTRFRAATVLSAEVVETPGIGPGQERRRSERHASYPQASESRAPTAGSLGVLRRGQLVIAFDSIAFLAPGPTAPWSPKVSPARGPSGRSLSCHAIVAGLAPFGEAAPLSLDERVGDSARSRA